MPTTRRAERDVQAGALMHSCAAKRTQSVVARVALGAVD